MRTKMLMTVVCLGAAIASAQTMQNSLHVNLPVEAKVGNVTLPAGSYSIHEVSNSVIQITSDSKKGVSTLATVMQIVAPNNKTTDHSSVVLRKNDSGYQVDKIWIEGDDMGLELNTAAE